MAELTPDQWARVQMLFERAADLPDAERRSFVDEACRDETTIRREVIALLATETSVGDFLEHPATTIASQWEDDPHEIDRYRVIRRIGSGGMGNVYLAERADDVYHQRVAIKVLKRGLDTDDIVRRFRLERQTLANLQHPNIARLIDGGRTVDGRPFLVLEYVNGLPIDLYCREHRLDVRERIMLFGTVCDAVSYAHRSLVVHRDLKPSNILVDADGEPKLLDFGVAKMLNPAAAKGSPAITTAGERLMTPRYASPEQIQGGTITTATDVYALGVVLYEMLAGRPPYDLESSSSSFIEKQVCEVDPSRPSTAATDGTTVSTEHTRQLRRMIRGDLDLIVLKTLRKEPERRYETVGALHDDLRRWLRSDPIVARPDSWHYRAGRFIARNRPAVIAAALVFVALITALVFATTARLHAEQRERDAEWRSYVSAIAAADSFTRPGLSRQRPYEALRLLKSCPKQHRAWEWEHLRNRADRSVSRFDTGDRPWDLAFSPDGRWIAAGLGESHGVLAVWDARSGAPVREFRKDGPEHAGRIAQVAWSPDGKSIATASDDGTVGLWDPETRQARAILPGRGSPIRSVTFDPNGRSLAAVGADGWLIAWDLVENRAFHERWQRETTPSAASVAFTGDRTSIVVADADGRLAIHDAESGDRIDTVDMHGEPAAIARAVDDRVLSLHTDGTVAVTRLDAPGTVVRTRPPTELTMKHAHAISPSGSMAAATYRNDVIVWRTSDGTVLAHLHGLRETPIVTDLAFSQDERRIAACSRETGRVLIWTLPPMSASWRLDSEDESADVMSVNQVTFDANSSLLAAARRGFIDVHDVETGLRLRRLDLEGAWSAGVAFLPPSTGQLVVGASSTVQWWDLTTSEVIRRCTGYRSRSLAIDRSRTRLAWGTPDQTVRVVDAADGRVIRELKGPKLRVYSVAFSPDGSLLVAGTGADDPKEQCDARAHVWDLRAGRHIRSLAGFGRSIYDVAIADDGTVFACGYRNAVYIWPPGQDEPVRHRPRGTQFRIWALDLSPDGRRLVIAAPDLAVRLLDVATGEEVLALPWAPPAKTACFSPNGRYVAAGSYHSSGKLRVWDRAPACDRVASVSVRHWHDQLDGDWDAVRVAIRDDQLLLDRQKLEAHAHVKRLAPWFSSSGGDRARRNRHESRLAEQTSPPQ